MDTILSSDLLRDGAGIEHGEKMRRDVLPLPSAAPTGERNRYTMWLHAARRLLRGAMPKPVAALARMITALYAAARHSIYTGE
jgi:hypothetical protein